MNRKEAIQIIGKHAPCPHYSANTSLGDGRTWAKCDDCGETFGQENWDNYIREYESFEKALDYLSKELVRY